MSFRAEAASDIFSRTAISVLNVGAAAKVITSVEDEETRGIVRKTCCAIQTALCGKCLKDTMKDAEVIITGYKNVADI